MNRFLVKLSLLTLLTGGAYYFFTGTYLPEWHYSSFAWIPLFFASVTLILHGGLVSRKSDSKKFIRYFLESMALKMLIYFTTLFLAVAINRDELAQVAICFLFHYATFTVFETAEAMELGKTV
jgi:hypothetical protein